mmetsp:Transcript_11613/g.25980  ORF Transcript_11613/g.25980 Transcript_11613/m.25980 type:complete len:211 (+) Transcript_11613:257-889(+)
MTTTKRIRMTMTMIPHPTVATAVAMIATVIHQRHPTTTMTIRRNRLPTKNKTNQRITPPLPLLPRRRRRRTQERIAKQAKRMPTLLPSLTKKRTHPRHNNKSNNNPSRIQPTTTRTTTRKPRLYLSAIYLTRLPENYWKSSLARAERLNPPAFVPRPPRASSCHPTARATKSWSKKCRPICKRWITTPRRPSWDTSFLQRPVSALTRHWN